MRRTTTVTTALAAMALAGSLAPATAADPGDAAPRSGAATCFGQPATLTGADADANGLITGTEGDDVIVSDGQYVEALGGNDLICATGTYWVHAGEGDDQVSSIAPKNNHRIVLGPGNDHFEGTEARDRVYAEQHARYTDENPPPDVPADPAISTDTIRTLGGNDKVISGEVDQVNNDDIELGEGRDVVDLAGTAGSGVEVDGGSGDDTVRDTGASEDLKVDLRRDSRTLGGQASGELESVERATVFTTGKLEVVGSNSRNWLYVGGGKSTEVWASGGRDTVVVEGCGPVLAAGGGGDDVIRSRYAGFISNQLDCRPNPVKLTGGPGADRLFGDWSNDTLVGGAGRDFADAGRKGRDVCRAERTRRC